MNLQRLPLFAPSPSAGQFGRRAREDEHSRLRPADFLSDEGRLIQPSLTEMGLERSFSGLGEDRPKAWSSGAV